MESFADHIARHHAADSQLHGQLGALPHQGAVLHFLQAADPAGVGAVILLLQFLAGEDGLLRIDDDDEVAAVGVGVYSGFSLPRSRLAAAAAVLPRGLPAASRTYHLRTMFPLLAIKVDIGETSIFFPYLKNHFADKISRSPVQAERFVL